MDLFEDQKKSNDTEEEKLERRFEKENDFISQITDKVNSGTLDPLDLLLIDDLLT